MPEYMVIIVGDADRWWTSMGPKERKDAYAEYARFAEELNRRGHKITGGAELPHTAEARSIRPGTAVVTDGPFTQTAEKVGGSYLMETDDRTVDPAERPS